MMKNVFYFISKAMFFIYLKSSFRSKDIEMFVLTIWSRRKNGLIKKINFKIYDVTTWLTFNSITDIAQYLTK